MNPTTSTGRLQSFLNAFVNDWTGTVNLLWSRLLLLLGALVVIKALLLVALNEHLFHTHWRVRNDSPPALDAFSFYLFVALVAASLCLLAHRCRDVSTRTIRRLNAGLGLAGCAFVFFSLHRVDSNYLWPVVQGWLRAGDIGWYLALDTFFGPPWLGLYLTAYAVVYWLLAKSRREWLSFCMLGAMAAIYVLANLQELKGHGRHLGIANCFGAAGLASAWRCRNALGPGWHLALALCLAGGWSIFIGRMDDLRGAEHYFAFFAGVTAAVYLGLLLAARKSEAYPVLSHWLPFYLVAFLLLANRAYPYAFNLSHVTMYALALPHYVWPEVCLALLALLVCVPVRRFAGRRAVCAFDAMAAVLVLVSLADLRLTQTTGVRLDWQAIVVANSPLMVWRTIRPYALQLIVVAVVLFGTYAVSLTWLTRRMAACARSSRKPAFRDAAFYGTAFLLIVVSSPWLIAKDKARGAALTSIVASSPLVRAMRVERYTPAEFARISRELGLPDHHAATRVQVPRSPADLNVLLIQMESSYNRHLSLFGAKDETQPLLSKHRDRMEVFPNFYSNFPNSFHARFQILSGLYATTDYVSYINPKLPAKSLPEILHEHGWVTSIFDSCFREYARWGDYIAHRQLDHFYDCNNMPDREQHKAVSWGVDEAVTMRAIRRQIAEHARKGERFFLMYLPVAPHMPFDLPDRRFARFDIVRGFFENDYTAAYKNLLLYMDWIYASIIGELETNGLLDRTLVIITNDHGEMLGDEAGKLGHGWNLEPPLANTPLIVMDPRRRKEGFRINYTPGSQVDVLPTLLDLLGIEPPAGELYQGVSLYGPSATPNRPIYITSYRHRALVEQGTYVLEDPKLNGVNGRHWTQMYAVRNDGPRTLFEPVQRAADVSGRLDRFQRFQISFITHYTQYRDGVRALQSRGPNAAATPPK